MAYKIQIQNIRSLLHTWLHLYTYIYIYIYYIFAKSQNETQLDGCFQKRSNHVSPECQWIETNVYSGSWTHEQKLFINEFPVCCNMGKVFYVLKWQS